MGLVCRPTIQDGTRRRGSDAAPRAARQRAEVAARWAIRLSSACTSAAARLVDEEHVLGVLPNGHILRKCKGVAEGEQVLKTELGWGWGGSGVRTDTIPDDPKVVTFIGIKYENLPARRGWRPAEWDMNVRACQWRLER
jgi:hypothetical protein